MAFEDIVHELISDEDKFIPLLIFTGLTVLFVTKSTAKVLMSMGREKTRREVAAFIAEGSMTPEQGERLMAAGNPKYPGCG